MGVHGFSSRCNPGSLTSSERFGVYVVPDVDWNLFSAHTKVTANDDVRVLLTYDEFYILDHTHINIMSMGGEIGKKLD